MPKAKLDMALAGVLCSRKKLMKIKKRVMMFMRYLVYHYLQRDKKIHRKCSTNFMDSDQTPEENVVVHKEMASIKDSIKCIF
jgi:hypothetical protein